MNLVYAQVLICILSVSSLSLVKAYPVSDNELSRLGESTPRVNSSALQLWVTISAEKRFIEVSWINAPAQPDDYILLTAHEPSGFEKAVYRQVTFLAAIDNAEGSGYIPLDGYTTTTTKPTAIDLDNVGGSGSGEPDIPQPKTHEYWISKNGAKDIVAAVQPTARDEWLTTGVRFDYALSKKVTANTKCYGYWVSYINGTGHILASNCIRAYPRWMHDLRSIVGDLRLRDLLIPGTHDAGSVKPNFDPLKNENIVTKYSLTQDDIIRDQLMHGARYLDLRPAYYNLLPKTWYINHGVLSRQRPMDEVVEQIKQFVRETNEIVIVGLKEFPVGFNNDMNIHRMFVEYLREQFGSMIVDPSVTWSATLNDIWARKQNVILAYDEKPVVREFPNLLFDAVQQRWGDVQTWNNLESYLRKVNGNDISRLSSRPVADMAELTPATWDVISDKLGGLRRMADGVNWRLSKLYHDELGERTNIVALDFIRGTNIMDLALDINRRKINPYY